MGRGTRWAATAVVVAVAVGCTTPDGLEPRDDDRSSAATSRGDDEVADPLADRREELARQLELLRARPAIGLFLCSRREPGCDEPVTEARLEELRAQLEGAAGTSGVVVLSADEAYEEFLEVLGDDPAAAETVGPEDLPRTIRFDLVPGGEDLLDELRREPDVVDVVDQRVLAVRLEQLLSTPVEQLAELHDQARERTLVSVALCVDAAPGCAAPATDAELAAVRETLEADARVDDLVFLTAEDNQAAFRDLLGDVDLDLDGLGPSFRFTVRSADADAVTADVGDHAGVLEVTTYDADDLLA
ncbi:hypothetical protein FTX61_16945 [Nitriliruptoraceae bacterium ZYF776]|nr:hypothetical protein [Profundirhabdus halotolerans]